MSLKDILHELAGRVNAPHLHEDIDALPGDEAPAEEAPADDAPAEPEAEAEVPKGGKK